MPTYEYICEKCEERTEVFMPLREFTESFLAICPHCGGLGQQELTIVPPAIEDWGKDGQGRQFEHLGPRGLVFHDKRSYHEHLKRNGLREWRPKQGNPGCEV